MGEGPSGTIDVINHFVRTHAQNPPPRPRAFLTTEANAVVARIHPKAMPAILTTVEEVDQWLEADTPDALALQLSLPDDAPRIVAKGEKEGPAHVHDPAGVGWGGDTRRGDLADDRLWRDAHGSVRRSVRTEIATDAGAE